MAVLSCSAVVLATPAAERRPDLVVSGVGIADNGLAVTYTVANRSDVPTGSEFRVSVDVHCEDGAFPIGLFEGPARSLLQAPLAARAERTSEMGIVPYRSWCAARVIADPENQIEESDEGNNETTARVPYVALRFRNVAVHKDGQADAFVSLEVVNVGAVSSRFHVQGTLTGVPGLLELQGSDLAPGAIDSLSIPSERLRPGRNELVLRLKVENDRDRDVTSKTYKKAVAAGLPDLKVVDARRARPGTYIFKVKNAGHAASPPYRVNYLLSHGERRGYSFATPDPAPGLPPGQAREFVLENIPEDTTLPWFQCRIYVDPDQAVVEEREDNNHATTGFGKQPFGGFF